MVCNLIWFASLLTVVLAPFTLIGLLQIQKKVIENKPLFVREFVSDSFSFGLRPLLLFLLQAVLMGIAFFNLSFYITHFGVLGLFMTLCSLLILSFISAIFFFAYPLVLFGHSVVSCLRIAFFLSVKHLVKVILFFIVSCLITFLGSLSVVAVPFILMAILASFWGNLFDQIKRIEGLKEERPLPEKTLKEIFFPFHG